MISPLFKGKPKIKVKYLQTQWDRGSGVLLYYQFTIDAIPDIFMSLVQVSKACTSICTWVRAMHKYHFVAKAVAPKREALALAQKDLEETQAILDAAKSRSLNELIQD